jgi:diguanylate cyclase (GGDEF)-like protein
METPSFGTSFWLTGRVIYPILAIVAACFAAAAYVVIYFTGELDRSEVRHAGRFASAVLSDRLTSMERTIVDYAAWGELYEHLHKSVDARWAYDSDNLGRSLNESFDFDYVMLFNAAGREAYTVVDGKLAEAPAGGTIGAGLDTLIRRAQVAGIEDSVPITGIGLVGPDPILLAAAAISTGGDPNVQPIAGPSSVLVFGQRLTPDRLEALGETMFVRNFRAAVEDPSDTAPTRIVLASADGTAQLVFRWDPDAHGRSLADRVLPILGITGLRQAFQSSAAIARAGAALVEAHTDAEHRARHDTTTDLPNRIHLMGFLDRRLASSEAVVSLLFLDLDRFKPVNDSLGHHAGDFVLREVARRLQLLVPSDGLVARVGGDEFVMVAPGFGAETAAKLCGRILAAIAAPIIYDDTEITVGTSIGVARSPADATEPGELIRKADIALYQAKTDGRGTFCFFACEMNERILSRRTLETDLRRALRAREFTLVYQPRVDARTLEVRSVEALVRWNHPERGLLPPSEFIGLAEEIGLIVPLGEWILQEACETVARFDGLSLSVNVSPAQFVHDGLAPMIAATLARTGLPAGRLELELTETVLLEDTARARRMLESLKRLGVKLSMDDFGTGYSSIGYLRSFPFDAIKIDRQFIADLGQRGDARSIVQAIVGLGRALDLDVVAEGVETAEQLLLLRTDQCGEVQGFLTGGPMPIEALEKHLAALSAAPRTDDLPVMPPEVPLRSNA